MRKSGIRRQAAYLITRLALSVIVGLILQCCIVSFDKLQSITWARAGS